MDPISLAGAAIALLAPYLDSVLKGGAEGAAEGLGEALAGRLGALLSGIKRRFRGDGYAEGALERFEAQPDEALRRDALKDALAEIVAQDAKFAEELQTLVEEAQRAGGVSVEQHASDSGALAGRDFTQNARFAAGRDQVFGAAPSEGDRLAKGDP